MQGTVSTWVYTQLACAPLTELFKHVFKHGFTHIRDVRHARNCFNMGLHTVGMCNTHRTV